MKGRKDMYGMTDVIQELEVEVARLKKLVKKKNKRIKHLENIVASHTALLIEKLGKPTK